MISLRLIQVRRTPRDNWRTVDAAVQPQHVPNRVDVARREWPGYEVREHCGEAEFVEEPMPRTGRATGMV